MQVLKKKTIKIEAPTKIISGDPYFLNSININPSLKDIKKCVIKKRLPKNMKAEMIIKEIIDEFEGKIYNSIVVDIIAVSNKLDNITQEKYLKAFKKMHYYTSDISTEYNLITNSEYFKLITNKGQHNFNIEIDGVYGNYIFYKNMKGYNVSWIFDAELFDFNEITKIYSSLF